jgi:hypothetical protein
MTIIPRATWGAGWRSLGSRLGLFRYSKDRAADQAGHGDLPHFGGLTDPSFLFSVHTRREHHLALALF